MSETGSQCPIAVPVALFRVIKADMPVGGKVSRIRRRA